jgi:hypothetical protein
MFSSRNRIKLGMLISIIAVALFGGGCAMNARPEKMTPCSFGLVNKHPQTVSLHVFGGGPSGFNHPTEISDADFLSALTKAVQESQVFSQIAADSDAAYILTVNIAYSANKDVGFDMKDTLTATWELRSTHPNGVVWKDIITTDFTSKFGDALDGGKRFRLAREGAARKNIQTGLQEISALELD